MMVEREDFVVLGAGREVDFEGAGLTIIIFDKKFDEFLRARLFDIVPARVNKAKDLLSFV